MPMYSPAADGSFLNHLDRAYLTLNDCDRLHLTVRSRCSTCPSCETCQRSRETDSFKGSQAREKLWKTIKFDEDLGRYKHTMNFEPNGEFDISQLPSGKREAFARFQQIEASLRRL